ncbi:aa3-type cytochrome c oxidase subunit IV [Sphingomonas sp. 1P06PA]
MANETTGMDYKAHEGTYGGFLSLLKIGTVITVILTAIVVLLIAN